MKKWTHDDNVEFTGNYQEGFYTTTKFPSGVTGYIEFYPGKFSDDSIHYSVWLTLYRKRKHKSDNFLKQTGEDGLTSLIWGRNVVIAFEDFITEEYSGRPEISLYIDIGWEDNRRRRVYHRYLSRIGYEYQTVYGEKKLTKKIQ